MEQVNPYMDRIMAALRNRAGAQASTSTTERYCSPSLIECGLDNVDCQKCGNTGVIPFVDEFGCLRSRECGCMKRRLSIRRIDNSGLRDLLQKYSFDNYQTPTEEHAKIRNKALSFAVSGAEWFFICGKPGTGKTHICTAICSSLLDRGWELRYMVWRTDAAELKAMITDRQEYKTAMNRLRNAAVLYIDDFFKGSITPGDVNVAFSILNDRYNSRGKKTIISTELPIDEIAKIDDAIAGRIAEKARGFLLQAPDLNWRMI